MISPQRIGTFPPYRECFWRVIVVSKQEKLSLAASRTLTTEAKTLTAEEERILRMRTGISLPPEGELESKLDGVNEEVKASVMARLALIQMEALRNQATEDQDNIDTERRTRIIDALKLMATDE